MAQCGCGRPIEKSREGQRHCRTCHRGYMRAWRAQKGNSSGERRAARLAAMTPEGRAAERRREVENTQRARRRARAEV